MDHVVASRTEIRKHFEIREGRIVTPGRFDGQRIYIPYFWEKVNNGWQDDEEEDGTFVFFVMPEDQEQFPELKAKTEVRLSQQDDGTIHER